MSCQSYAGSLAAATLEISPRPRWKFCQTGRAPPRLGPGAQARWPLPAAANRLRVLVKWEPLATEEEALEWSRALSLDMLDEAW